MSEESTGALRQGAELIDVRGSGEQIPESRMRFEIYFDLFQQYRWRMLDESGAEIAVSPQGYYNKIACERYVELMRAFAATADVQDRTTGMTPPSARAQR